MNIQSEAAEWEDAVNSDRAKFVLRPASFPHVATLVLVTEDGDGRSSERLVALFAQMDPGLVVLAAMGAATGAEIESKIEGHEPPEIRKRKSKKQSKRRPKADVPKPEPKPEPPTKPAPQPETAAAEPEPKPHTEVAPTSKPAPAVKLKPRKPARAPKPKPAPTRHAVMLWLVKANPGITVTALQDRPELEGYGAVGRQTRKEHILWEAHRLGHGGALSRSARAPDRFGRRACRCSRCRIPEQRRCPLGYSESRQRRRRSRPR